MSECVEHTIDFILKEDDPEAAAVEDDIRADLEKIGIKVNAVFLDSDGYTNAERNGTYHMLFSRTWVRSHPGLQLKHSLRAFMFASANG